MEKYEKNEELEKAMKKIKIMDKIRIITLFLALLLVLFIFYGNKLAKDAAWFISSVEVIYNILSITIIGMLFCSLLKIYFVAKYNFIIKKEQNKKE